MEDGDQLKLWEWRRASKVSFFIFFLYSFVLSCLGLLAVAIIAAGTAGISARMKTRMLLKVSYLNKVFILEVFKLVEVYFWNNMECIFFLHGAERNFIQEGFLIRVEDGISYKMGKLHN
jgi:hypothetical protein